MIAEQDIIMLEPQAKRAFLAVEVQGDGQLGMSEYENFLMLYDIMGHTSTDLLIMDIYDYFKMLPNKEDNELLHQKEEGLDYSALLEGLHMLGVAFNEAEGGDSGVKKTFMRYVHMHRVSILFFFDFFNPAALPK